MMSVLIVCASFAIAVAVAVPILVFAVQIFVAARTGHVPPQDVRRPGFAVIVPAHDEEQGIAPTLQSIRRELTGSDRLVVVADNCSDRTADVAAAAGAEVTSRNDPMHRGKGFALDHGLQFLTRTGAPEVVIIVDADCQVAEGALARIAALAASTARPVQAAYLMAPTRSGDLSPIRNLAWFTKNYVRPLGWLQLGLPTQLTGSGMSFPTHLLGSVSLATDELVEDLSLGLKLALRGRAPLFCPEAVVTSQFPEDVRAEKSQRTRWEHGYLHSIITHVLWLEKVAYRNVLTTTFINANTAAVYLGASALAWLLLCARSLRLREVSRRHIIRALFERPSRRTLICSVAFFLTLSASFMARRYVDFPLFRAPQTLVSAVSQSSPLLLLAVFHGHVAAGFFSLCNSALGAPAWLLAKTINDIFFPRLAELANHEASRGCFHPCRRPGAACPPVH